MKEIGWVAGIAVLMAGAAQADLVYSTDFTGDAYTQNTGAIVFDNGTTTATNTWFGTNNGVGISGGELSFNNSTANRGRGSGVWLDASAWEAGLVTVKVDVANYVAGDDTALIFQAYAANGVDAANTVSLDLHGNAATAPGTTAFTGSATIGTLGAEQYITANGTDVAFTFSYNGTDDFVGLVFSQRNVTSGTEFGSADVDNLTVNAIPEPATLGMVVAFGGGLLFIRRRFML